VTVERKHRRGHGPALGARDTLSVWANGQRVPGGTDQEAEMQSIVADDTVVAGLRQAPRSAWVRLLDAVDVVGVLDHYGVWRGGMTIEGGDGVVDMPWVDYVDEVDRLVQALYEVNAVVNFDSIELDIARQMVTSDPANVTDTVRMITTIVRVNRFSEGQLLRSLEDGTLPTLVRRLASWYRSGS
jgi:hypothetical protein